MTTTQNEFLTPKAAALVSDPGCFIDGRWETGTEHTITKLNPTNGEVLGQYACAGHAQVERAVAAARRAHEEGVWRGLAPVERATIMRRFYELFAAHQEDLLSIVVADVGTPVGFGKALQMAGALWNYANFAELARKGPDGWFEQGLAPDRPETEPWSASVLVREPLGVVAAISAYNFPYTIPAWKMGAALATGNTTVLLPSPRTVLSTVAMFKLFEEAGFPPGVVNMVIGEREVGEQLSSHEGVDAVTFTGSVPVGEAVMRQAASGVKKVVLELGGKSPSIMMPGVDVEATIASTVLRLVTNSGQRCGATSRLIVHEDDMEKFTAALRTFVDGIVVGDPRSPDTLIGPLVDTAHQEFVQGHVDRALADGAQVLAGGAPVPAEFPDGAFFTPLFLGGVPHDHPLFQEELFGPVGAVATYKSLDEAVDLANDSDFGLNANVNGPPVEAMKLARRIKSGTVTINGGGRFREDAPWGGYGKSGVGREAGNEGLREFIQVKHIQWPIA
jgi:aldehyde dehydrogenase (NAD+)/betaine-aldehyde dehydrogenase